MKKMSFARLCAVTKKAGVARDQRGEIVDRIVKQARDRLPVNGLPSKHGLGGHLSGVGKHGPDEDDEDDEDEAKMAADSARFDEMFGTERLKSTRTFPTVRPTAAQS